MTVRYDDPNIEQRWEGRVAYVRHQAQALCDAGWTYPQAVDRCNALGVDKPDPRKSKDSTNNLPAKPRP